MAWVSFGSSYLHPLYFWICISVSFLREFSAITSAITSFQPLLTFFYEIRIKFLPFSLSSPGSPMMRIWNHLMLSHKSLKLFSFFFLFAALIGEFHCLSLSWLMVPLLHLICCWTHVVYFFSLYSSALWLLLDTFLYWVGQKFVQLVNTLFNKVLGENE